LKNGSQLAIIYSINMLYYYFMKHNTLVRTSTNTTHKLMQSKISWAVCDWVYGPCSTDVQKLFWKNP
jgi:hypothetical protein